MNILTFGVKIDPSGAESGSRAARAAMDKLKDALADVKKAAGAASEALGKTSDKGAFGKITGAATAAARAVTGAFSGMVRAVTGTVTGITKALGSIGLALDGLRMTTAPMRGFLGDVIGDAADMEGFRNQWAYILGSFDKARTKMRDLQEFAKNTPFNLPGVTQAALHLQRLDDASKKTMEFLTKVGDAAARVPKEYNAGISDIASRIVRLSNNLASGSGGGDELRFLKEVGIIGPEAGRKIAEMSTDANKFREAMALVTSELEKSKDAMLLLAETWHGKTSTLEDSWTGLKTAIGEPLIEGLKPMLEDFTAMIDKWREKISEIAPQIKGFAVEISAGFKVLNTDGGITLTLHAAADLFIELLKRGFEILGKMLSNIFEVIGHKFMEIMKRIASFEFWEGVGRALVSGVKAALEAEAQDVIRLMLNRAGLKGSLSDDVMLGLGFEPQSFKDATAKAKELQSIAAELAGPYKRQNNPSRYANYRGTTDEVTLGPNGEAIHNVRPNGSVRAEEDVNTIVRLHQRLAELERPSAKWEPAPGPSMLSPFEINESLGPLPQTPAMLEFQRRQNEQREATLMQMTESERRSQSALPTVPTVPTGGPEATLFPPGSAENPIDYTTTVESQKQLFPQIDREGTGAFLDEATGQTKELTDSTLEYGDALNKSGEMAQAAFGKAGVGASKMIDHIMKARTTMDDMANQMVDSLTNNVGNAFADIITGAKSAKEAFADMANNIVGDIVKMITKLLVQYAIMKAIGFATGKPTVDFPTFVTNTLSAGVHHTGGIVGMGGETRPMGSEVFAGAVRYHTGGNIGRNEVPAILEKGETVLTKEQASGIARRLDGRGGSDSAKPANVTIINLSDPNSAQAELARNPDAILNLIAGNLPKVREMVYKKGPR